MRKKTNNKPFSYSDYAKAYKIICQAQLDRIPYSAIIGESGTGKTTLVRELKSVISQTGGIVLYSSIAHNSSYGFLQIIADALHLSLRRSKQETIKMIIQTLSIMQQHVFVWLDEAHFMSSEIFHEIRMLSESVLDKESLFSVLFIGQPELKQQLKSATMYAVARRINPIVEMNGLLREEITPFINHYFDEGCTKQFSPESLVGIFEQSAGNPSKIIHIVDRCLGEYSDKETINYDMVSNCIDNYFNN